MQLYSTRSLGHDRKWWKSHCISHIKHDPYKRKILFNLIEKLYPNLEMWEQEFRFSFTNTTISVWGAIYYGNIQINSGEIYKEVLSLIDILKLRL